MGIDASRNFRRLSERLTTSGSVSSENLSLLRENGYEAVINLLPDTSEHAVSNEGVTVQSQGAEYIHIPVDFGKPAPSDFVRFCDALDRTQDKKVHVHCAANYRVSAFYALYSVARGDWTEQQAMAFIRSIWQPEEYPGWSEFIAAILSGIGDKQRSSGGIT